MKHLLDIIEIIIVYKKIFHANNKNKIKVTEDFLNKYDELIKKKYD